MNKLALLVAATGVLAGCQSFEPTQQGVRSVYSGDNSVLYQVRKQAGSANQAMLMADAAYRGVISTRRCTSTCVRSSSSPSITPHWWRSAGSTASGATCSWPRWP